MRSTFFLLFLSFCIISCKEKNKTSNLSDSKYAIKAAGSCNYSHSLTDDNIFAFSSDADAKNAIARIMQYTGLPANFKLMAADIDNAAAVNLKNTNEIDERFILYNQKFMIAVRDLAKNNWAELSIMAHEIGHHLCGHTLAPGGSKPDNEIEADRFSGFILNKMGASLEQAETALNLFAGKNGSSTHPPLRTRLAAVTNGWVAANEQKGMSNNKEIKPSDSPNPNSDYDEYEIADLGYSGNSRNVLAFRNRMLTPGELRTRETGSRTEQEYVDAKTLIGTLDNGHRFSILENNDKTLKIKTILNGLTSIGYIYKRIGGKTIYSKIEPKR